MMENSDSLVLFVFEYTVELNAIPMKLSQVQRAKILVISLINEDAINVKKEAIRNIFGRVTITIPIQSI